MAITILRTPNPVTMALMGLLLSSGMAILPFLILEYSVLDEIADRMNFVRSEESFDFIVVGSGSSGSVVANRLSEKFKVLLIEAGGEPFPMQAIPVLAPAMLQNPTIDWNFYTVPQKHSCFSLYNQSSYWPRGKSLGGTSNLNFMVWLRGHPFDYDNWAQITGEERWGYDELLPYFKKSENFTGEGDPNFHGYDGEVTLSPSSYSPIAKYFVRAAEELGYPILDQNAPYQEGFNEHIYNQKGGQRWSAYNAFIQPLLRSTRLTIRKYSLVTKVLFKGSKNLAYGVEYERAGVRYIAEAKKEVILSAGAIGSPKILMLSGIGPADHLKSVGIKPRKDLPGVGKNLQDHIIGLVGPFTINKADGQSLTYHVTRDSNPSDLLQYLGSGTGPLTQAGVMASGFVASNTSKLIGKVNDNGIMWPDIQLILLGIPTDKAAIGTLSKIYNLNKEIAQEFYEPVDGLDNFHIMSIASRPKSRGHILLASADPKTPPLIDPNYYEDPKDIATTIEGIRKAQALVENSKTFQDIGAKLSSKPFPSCTGHEFNSDEYWECYLRHYTLSVYHPASTCSMGRADDPNAVVDGRLNVIGTERLRIIDSSVMVQIVSSNIQAACTVIGEVGSQFIKEYWGIAP